MASKIGRREFLSRTAKLSAGAVLGERILSGMAGGPAAARAAGDPGLAVVSGTNYAAMTAQAGR